MHLPSTCLYNFGKIGLLDTQYFSNMKFPHMFG